MVKEKQSRTFLIAAVILILLMATAAYLFFKNRNPFSVDDQVYGEWTTKVWYPGKIDKTCEKGFHIVYNDGDEKCLSPEELVADTVPGADDVKVGSEVITQYLGGPFYAATVTTINSDDYEVMYAFDKQIKSKKLNELRLLK